MRVNLPTEEQVNRHDLMEDQENIDLLDIDDVNIRNTVQGGVTRTRWHHRGHSRRRYRWEKNQAQRRHRQAIRRIIEGGKWDFRPLTAWDLW